MNQYSLDAAAQLLLETTRETNCDGGEEETAAESRFVPLIILKCKIFLTDTFCRYRCTSESLLLITQQSESV